MLLILLKSSACLAVFMLFYKLCLEKTSAHIFKRFYLIVVILISIGIPFIAFTKYVETESVNLSSIGDYSNAVNSVAIESESFQDYIPIIFWSIYALGAVLFSIRFFKNLYQIIQKIKANTKFKNQNYINVLLLDLINPHTFFNYIFLNKNMYEHNLIPTEVLLHEQTHAKQKHAIDILFIEILQILFWFNPLLYFIKKDIKLNHEFLADQAVINKGTNTKHYQQLLLAFSSNASHNQLANAINYSLIKKRFTVMKTKTSKTIIWFRSLIILPLLAILIYSFSAKKEATRKEGQIDYILNNKNDSLINDVTILINKKNQVFLNNKPTSLNQLLDDINKLNPNLTIEQKRKFLHGSIIHQTNTSKDFIKKAQGILFKANIWGQSAENMEVILKNNLKTNVPMLPHMNFENLSEEDKVLYRYQLNKYKECLSINNPNKKLIETEKGYIIKNANDKITVSTDPTIEAEPFELKKDSPWKISTEVTNVTFKESLGDIQQKATQEQVEEYNTLAKKYNTQPEDRRVIKLKDVKRLEYLYSLMNKKQKASAEPFPNCPPPPPAPPVVKKGEISDIPEPPAPPKAQKGEVSDIPSPPAPKPPLDHVIDMAKKGAIFYYNGKKISSDKAIELLKNNKDLNISSKTNNGVPVVKIQTDPIRF